MLKDGRIPLWLVATVAGTGVLVVVGLFFYGSYVAPPAKFPQKKRERFALPLFFDIATELCQLAIAQCSCYF